MNKPLIEACVDSYASCVAAWKGGADRLELCAHLIIGGVTPSPIVFRQVQEDCDGIKTNVLIRPRFGDFLYTEKEMELQCEEIKIFRDLGANGVVIGALWGFSKKVDIFMTEVYNVVANVPYILLISVLVLIFSPSFWTMVCALTVTGWLTIAYFIRTQVMIIRDREYNLASRCLGTNVFRIAVRNILPFMTSIIVTLAATEIPSYISYEVFLSYIGMGLSDMSLGKLIYSAESAMVTPGWGFEFWSPVALASFITVVLYVVGQNLGDASDPRTHM